jgi:potassium efflux system protein
MPAFNKMTFCSVLCLKTYFLLLIYCLLSMVANAQKSDTVPGKIKDTTDRAKLIQEISEQEAERSMQAYKTGRISIQQDLIFDEVRKENQRLRIYLKNVIDTAGLKYEMVTTDQMLAITKEGVFVNKGTFQSQRNLSVSAVILNDMLNIMTKQKQTLDSYTSGLIRFRVKMDSLYSDTVIYINPSDPVKLTKYLNKVAVIMTEISTVDSNLNKSLSSLQELQFRVDVMVNQLQFDLEEIELYTKDAATRNMNREYANIWSDTGHSRPFGQIIRFSVAKEKLALGFYVRDNLGLIVILIILWLICFAFLVSLKRQMVLEKIPAPLTNGQIVIRYPILSAVVIVFGLFQFLFPKPPFIFSFCLWIISAFSLTIIIIKYVRDYWIRYWFIMSILFILAGLDYFIIQASRLERWAMLGLSLAGVVYALWVLFGKHKRELREKAIMYFIALAALCETGSTMMNIFGRYNLSKSLLIGGYTGVIVAVLLFWAAKLINQCLELASQKYRSSDRNSFVINSEKAGDKLPVIFYVLLVVGWFFLVGKNFYVFKLISQPLSEFFTNERTIGAYSFSIGSLFLFILILFCSFFLSHIISLFTSDSGQVTGLDKKSPKANLGRWMLLFRIFVISVGIFLSFAAAGIPLDRITIILGALGVGIGLGLQGLVNNLVSGLIIAFEKPVEVGDIIELQGSMATMKSIGFRSSIIHMSDGASVIIPNGDLLSTHLVNWSMSRQIKRNSLVVGVAYNTNLTKANHLLMEILKNNNNILQHPPPTVLAKGFYEKSIDFELLFWVKSNWASAISEVISEIEIVFEKEGIDFPISQFIHSGLPSNPIPSAPNIKNPEDKN